MHVELINLCRQMERPVSQNQSTGNLSREAAQVVWQKVMNEIWIRSESGGKSAQSADSSFFFNPLFFLKFLTPTTKEHNSCLVHLHSHSEWRMTQTGLGEKQTFWYKRCNHKQIRTNQQVYRNKMCFRSVPDTLQNIIISKINCIFLKAESNIITVFFV